MELEQGADNDNRYLNDDRRNSKAKWYYEMQLLGFNYRISDIQCALGISQLGKMDDFLKRRKQIVARYNSIFQEHPLIKTPVIISNLLRFNNIVSVYQR